jgi:Glycosyl transferase WecG/TagA/CpsF family
VIFTAGGWLDQLADRPQYFPPLVHQLRLGWLLRIIREPRRLVRRYTLDAVSALRHIATLPRHLKPLRDARCPELSTHAHFNQPVTASDPTEVDSVDRG